ncbi:MAG: right-handed parallel beta-helix repeat-containing protein [bacterium]|nr:MAG: right-handed parallel beta-helix repeat-containing protein [bacterium]
MKLFCLRQIIGLVFLPWFLHAHTLQEMYNQAIPGLGYDRLIELERDSIYTGGLIISDESVGIRGQGALIDLQGSSISVNGESSIDIDGCIILNGYNGLYAQDDVTARISRCTFYQNDIGIHFMSEYGYIEVVNTILTNNFSYGFACDERSMRVLHYIDAYQNLLGDYMEWCPT